MQKEEKVDLSVEAEELFEKMNRDYEDVRDLVGLGGGPRFLKGQEFTLQSDDESKEIVLNLDKISGRSMVLSYDKRKYSKPFSKDSSLELLSLNDKIVKFKVLESVGGKLKLAAKTYQDVELPEPDEDHTMTRAERRRELAAKRKIQKRIRKARKNS